MSAPLVSILTPAYNAGQWIDETLASARAQTWSQLEVIVVDDGSTDDTLARAQRHAAEDARIHVLTGANAGACAARNRAFEASRGAYIQYLDADDLIAPNKLERQMTRLLAEDPAGRKVATAAWDTFIQDPAEAAFNPGGLWKDFRQPLVWLIQSWTTGDWMQPGAFLSPRSLIERAGPWDERLTLHDDGEFFARVLLKSAGVLFCQDARAYYRKGVEGSLSAVHKPRAVESFFLQCSLYEQHLLEVEDSPETRRACAAVWQNFYFTYYPRYPEKLAAAAAAVRRLGGSDAKPRGSALFQRLSKVIGWKSARRIEDFARAQGITPGQLRKRFS